MLLKKYMRTAGVVGLLTILPMPVQGVAMPMTAWHVMCDIVHKTQSFLGNYARPLGIMGAAVAALALGERVTRQTRHDAGDRLMRDGVEHGNPGRLSIASYLGGSPNVTFTATGGEQMPALAFACATDNADVARQLLRIGANPAAVDSFGLTPMHHALAHNPSATFGLLVGTPGDPGRFAGTSLQTPVHAAAESGNTDALRWLLEHGYNLGVEAAGGETPLITALRHRREGTARFLIGHGADVGDTQRKITRTFHALIPGDSAAVNGVFADAAQELMENLRNYRIDDVLADLQRRLDLHIPLPFATYDHGSSLLHWVVQAAARDTNPANRKGYLDIIREVAHFPHAATFIGASDERGVTPLHCAFANQQIDLAEALMRYGASLTCPDTGTGGTPLHIAAGFLHDHMPASISSYITAENVDVRDRHHKTPLHWAAKNGNAPMVQMLITAGADLQAQCKDLNTPLHYAIDNNHMGIVELLLAHHASVTMVNKAGVSPLCMIRGNPELVHHCIAQRDECGEQLDQAGSTLLHQAVKNRDYPAMLAILQSGQTGVVLPTGTFDPSAASSSNVGESSSPTVEKYAQTYQINPSQRDASGKTPLHYAAQAGDSRAIRMLIESGACCNALDDSYENPLCKAARAGDDAAIEELIRSGENISQAHTFAATNDRIRAYAACARDMYKILEAGSIAEFLHVLQQTLEHGFCLPFATYANRESLVHRLIRALGRDQHIDEALYNKALGLLVRFPHARQFFGACDIHGQSPLHYAVAANSPFIVAILAEHMASLNMHLDVCDAFGKTPLHYAVQHGFVGMVELLVRLGASGDVPDNQHDTPLGQAALLNNTAIIDELVGAGADVLRAKHHEATSPHLRAYIECAEMINRMHQQGMMQDLLRLLGDRAAHNQQLPFALYKNGDSCMHRIMHLAARDQYLQDHIDCYCRVIRSIGEFSNGRYFLSARDGDGKTPLHFAAIIGNSDLISAILECDRTLVDRIDKKGRRPIDYARTCHAEDTALAALLAVPGAV